MRKLLSVLSSTLQGGLRGGLLFLALLATTSLWAEDFSVDGIYYNYLDGNNVEVTYRGSGFNSYSYEYSGDIVIPETVTYNGTTYSVTSIRNSAFNGCSSLTSITIPNSVTSIGNYAFYQCYSLTSITIPNSVTSIGNEAFSRCSSLTSMILTASSEEDFCKGKGNYLLYSAGVYCQRIIQINGTEVTDFTIPNSVTSIGDYAFSICSSLTSITIPNSVTSIGFCAFRECSGLMSMVVESGNTVYDSRENCNAIIETATNTLIAGCQNTIIPNSVTSIGDYAFVYCKSLTSITIPNSVKSIGAYAFADCSSLTSITIPNSVTSIGGGAFGGCSSLTSITISNSVTSIGDEAFWGCSSLTSITIPNSVTSIGSSAFRNCSSLTSITIPNSVTSIGGWAFAYCSSLTSVTIGNSVTSIGEDAFRECSGLTSITCEATIPPTLGYRAFDYVSKSIPVYVPCESVNAYKAAYGWKEFYNIQEPLAEYSIQVSTSNSQMGSANVDYNTFCEGSQISAIANYGYHFVQWSDGVTDNPRTLVLTQDTVLTAEFAQIFSGQCGDNLYWSYQNNTLTVSGFGEMYNERPWGLFVNEIQTVVLPNGITHIGDDAFSDCTGLSEITIPYTVTSIGDYAFAGCRKLYDIYCFAMEPPTAQQSSFANYNAFLHVPCENERVYLLDVVFGEFKYIECIDTENVPTDDVVVTPGFNDVTITWPTEGNADTYTIVIKKGDEVFCTLTFNAEGQLLNIAFAPGRNGNHPAQYAEQAANGYRFTVTGLEAGTHYAYNIDVRDAANKTITSHTGDFTTKSNVSTAVDDITTNANIQKIMRNGQIIILRDGVEYNVMGAEIQ